MSDNPEIFVPGGTVTDEEIREIGKKIMKEAEEQGLPWWSGMFNPEITKAALRAKDTKGSEEAAQEKARMEREAQFNKDMDDLRKIQKERDKLMLEADKTVLDAIQCAAEMMKSLQEEEEEKGVVAMDAADLGRAIAAMRESMNQKHYPVGYYGAV